MEDFDVDLGLGGKLDLSAIPVDLGVDYQLFDDAGTWDSINSGPMVVEADDEQGDADGTLQKAYHTKRPHKKSRRGCKQCKTRKVKCDEAKPTCRACTLRREKCVYPSVSHPAQVTTDATTQLTPAATATTSATPTSSASSPSSDGTSSALVIAEPLFRPAAVSDDTDMKMLWFYTTETYHSFSIEGGRSPLIDKVLKVKVVEHAFQSPFLMQVLMGLSAQQLGGMQEQEVPVQKLIGYQSGAFEGYRAAIEKGSAKDYPALLASSLLMTALSSQMFREPDSKPLYIVDWMIVWRGIGLIVEIISPQSIQDSGLAVLFYRPPIDLEKTTLAIPNNLLFMVTQIKPDDPDYPHQQTYYEMLKYLGALYLELRRGFSPIMDLRVITFFTFVPRGFIPLAKEYRPRALIILAHYCAFTKLNRGLWWLQGICDRQVREIREAVGPAWEYMLRVPLRVCELQDQVEIAKTILENHTWSPGEEDLYEKNRDPRIKDLKLINDFGDEAYVENGKWHLKSSAGLPVRTADLAMGNHVSPTPSTASTPQADIPSDLLLGMEPPDPSGPLGNIKGVNWFGIGNPLNPNPLEPQRKPQSTPSSATSPDISSSVSHASGSPGSSADSGTSPR